MKLTWLRFLTRSLFGLMVIEEEHVKRELIRG